MSSRLGYVWGTLALLLTWQAASWCLGDFVLAGPVVVLRRLFREVQILKFWMHVGSSWLRIAAALAISFLTAVPTGLIIGSSNRLDRYARPLIHLTYPVPKIVFLPIVFLIFGLGDLGKIAMLSIILFFQLLITTRDAARSVSRSARYSLYSLGGSRLDLFRHVIWPSCLPAIFTALRIATGTVVAVLFFVESVGTRYGRADIPGICVGMIVMALMGVVLYEIFDVLEKTFCRWSQL